MYRALAGVPGLTIVSVGHRPSLLQYHRQLLRLKGADASPCFELGPVEGFAPAECGFCPRFSSPARRDGWLVQPCRAVPRWFGV